jgi:xylulose-5-phosphate/fructose-6-phosphate phosphoketolase
MPFISSKHYFRRSRTKRNGSLSAHLPEAPPKGQIIESVNYAHENGIDKKEIRKWKRPL